MRLVNYLAFAILLFACSPDDKKSETAVKNNPAEGRSETTFQNYPVAAFYITDHEADFRHRNLLDFPRNSVTDLNFERPVYEIHKPIINDLHFQVFQDPNLIDSSLHEGTKVLYSIQNAKGHQGILIAGMDDGWVDNIIYRSYDSRGKFIAEAILYQEGGDGGYTTQAFGQFINDTTYIRHTIQCEPEDDYAGTRTCDSTAAKFYIHYNGTIETIQ